MCRKNVKNIKLVAIRMCSFKLQMHQNPFSGRICAPDPAGELTTLPHIHYRLGSGHPLSIPSPSTPSAFPSWFLGPSNQNSWLRPCTKKQY